MRLFLTGVNQVYDLEQKIMNKGIPDKVFQVILQNNSQIRRLIWFLLKENIMFTRKSIGTGVCVFYIDQTGHYFME